MTVASTVPARLASSRLAGPLVLLCLAATLAGCSAGPGLVSVPLVGTVPTGGAGAMTQTSMATGTSMADLQAQCEVMAQMAVDPAQPPAMREQLSIQAGLLGCPG